MGVVPDRLSRKTPRGIQILVGMDDEIAPEIYDVRRAIHRVPEPLIIRPEHNSVGSLNSKQGERICMCKKSRFYTSEEEV